MPRSFAIVAACLLALLAIVPQSSAAQDRPQTREGFFIGFGVGAGSFGCESCSDRETGAAAHLKLGGTLNPTLLLGVESSAWVKEVSGVTFTHANFNGIIQFYPSAESGFFLKGGVGISILEIDASGGGVSITAREEGLGVSGGLGYDIRLGSNFSLSPYALYALGSFDGGNANTAQLGLGVMWH